MNNPALWAETNFITRRFADDITREFENEIGKMSGRCIDIGSGPADVVVDIVLPKLNPNATIVCSDISDAMVEFGKKTYKDNDRVSYIKLDIETPDLPKDLIEQFDHATSFYCLHFCHDLRQVFKNIFDLLRPGGTTLMTFIAHHPGMNSYNTLAAMPRYQPYMKDVEHYIPSYQHSEHPEKILKALIEDVGFEVHHCSLREKSYVYEDPDVFHKLMLAGNPFVHRMPADLQKEYAKDLATESTRESIVFKKNNDDKNEYNILCLIETPLVYFRKPLTRRYPN